ncbi:MAG TPA: ABC transporter substrate-binding protein [Candidatus Acidoferrales bacterium]|nr:ABC transporter substrate-binding protein [Candidatus Acidoferrales bacterium]
MLRRLVASSVGAAVILLVALPGTTARRPRYGGALRVEIRAAVASLDPAVAAANGEEEAARAEIDSLIYDVRGADGTFHGAGAFHVTAFEAGKRVVLAATEDYRLGRPFVDSIEIAMGRTARDRIVDLELNKADFAEIPAEDARRAAERGVRVSRSQPDELLALVFTGGAEPGRGEAVNERVRQAIALSIDRAAIVNFILQKEGEPAGGLLPQWSSGTAFLFSTAADAAHAKELSTQIIPAPKIVLGYDFGDSLGQAVAERIAVNAREAGIAVTTRPMPQPQWPLAPLDERMWKRTPSTVDAMLVRVSMPSPNPAEALEDFAGLLGITTSMHAKFVLPSASPEEIYERESIVLKDFRVVPLVWLPRVYGLSARVRDWTAPAAGERWPLADVWLDAPPEAASEEGKK